MLQLPETKVRGSRQGRLSSDHTARDVYSVSMQAAGASGWWHYATSSDTPTYCSTSYKHDTERA